MVVEFEGEGLCVDGRMIEIGFKQYMCGLHSAEFVETPVADCYEHSAEVLVRYKKRNFLTVVAATTLES